MKKKSEDNGFLYSKTIAEIACSGTRSVPILGDFSPSQSALYVSGLAPSMQRAAKEKGLPPPGLADVRRIFEGHLPSERDHGLVMAALRIIGNDASFAMSEDEFAAKIKRIESLYNGRGHGKGISA